MSDIDHKDHTEEFRRGLQQAINSNEAGREALETVYGQVWDTQQLQADFEVTAFLAPFVGVVRKADGKRGTLMFQHNPRFYFKFEEG